MNPVFHIISEFKFEIGSAMANSETLAGAVDKISHSADNALHSFQRLGFSVAAQFGLGAGGILGTLYQAISASEKFGMTQRKLANIFLSNQDKIAGGPVTFLEAMTASDEIMGEILKKSREFSIPAQPLAEMTALLGAPLFASGAAGKNMAPAVDIARGVLKSAPVLGVHPGQAQMSVLNMLLGAGNMQDQFTSRLVQDTDVFIKLLGKKGHGPKSGGALGAFNVLPIDKRVKVITEALLQFASSTEIVEANAGSLTQQMDVLKDSIIGMFSVLKPIGDTIAKFLGPMLANFNKMIQTHGQAIANQLGMLLEKLVGSPDTLFKNLSQFKNLSTDLKSTARVFTMAGIVGTIGAGLKWLGITAKLASPWVSVLTGALTIFFDIFDRTPTVFSRVGMIAGGLALLGTAMLLFPPLTGIVAMVAGVTAIFQLFSRAAGIANLKDLKALPQLTEDFTRVLNAFMNTMGRIMGPLYNLFDWLAELASPLFEVSTYMEAFTNGLFKITYMFSFVQASIGGLISMMETYVSSFKKFNVLEIYNDPLKMWEKSSQAFGKRFDEIMSENLKSLTDPTNAPIANQITNVGKIEIKNDFKEQLEPDRIAFTLVEQIKRVAQNPGQATRRFSGVGVGH